MIHLINIYGGPCDGKRGVQVPEGVLQFPVFCSGLEMNIRYITSKAWSAYFGKRTAVPECFPGMPPRETAAA